MKRLLLSLILVFGVVFVYAQVGKSNEDRTLGVYFTPQYLVQNGIRFDLEKNIGNGMGAVVVAPSVYLRKKDRESGLYPYTELFGASLWLEYKHYLTERRITYLSLGPNFMFNYSKYKENDWVDDGSEMVYRLKEFDQNVYRVGMNATIGLNFEVIEKVRVDLFGGFGFRYAFINSDNVNGKIYMNDHFFEPAYTGTMLIGGVKFGVNL